MSAEDTKRDDARPDPRPRLVKLVRDRVPQFLTDGGVHYRRMPREDHVRQLRAKLVEEALEYVLNPSLGELADVQEAVRALALVDLGLDASAVNREAHEKRTERGGFADGVGMYVTADAPPRHEGEHGG